MSEWHRYLSVGLLGLCLLPALAFAGDDDQAPAYLIYIDPETGKYTTTDPAEAARDKSPQTGDSRPVTAADAARFKSSNTGARAATILAVIGAALLLALIVYRAQKMRRSSRHAGFPAQPASGRGRDRT